MNRELSSSNDVCYTYIYNHGVLGVVKCIIQTFEFEGQNSKKLSDVYFFLKWWIERQKLNIIARGWRDTQVYGHTGMCCPNGLIFHKKSLAMGLLFQLKNPWDSFQENCDNVHKKKKPKFSKQSSKHG